MKLRLLQLILLSLFLSCNKEPDSESKTALLTSKAWKFVKAESKVNNGIWVDEAQFWSTCKKDDEILFKTDHSYVLSNGATKCSPSDPQILDEATWKFLESETKIDMDGAITFIEKLDEQQFIISSNTTSGSDTYFYKYTLEH